MNARARSKPLRRELSSFRHFHQLVGNRWTPPLRGATSALPSSATIEASWVAARANLRPMETKTVMRLDGDSIAYFWALETETAISYETLAVHWRDFTDALTNTDRWV